MLYTNLGRVVAVLALIVGVLFIAVGLMGITAYWNDTVLMHFPGTSPELAHSPSRQQAGWYFDRGLYTVLFAIALGILTEISRNVRANTATANEAPAPASR